MSDTPFVPGSIKMAREKRDAARYEYNGEMLRISDISHMTGILACTIRARLKSGKSIEEAAANTDYRYAEHKPNCKSRKKRYEYEGEMLTVDEISERTGLSVCRVRYRIYNSVPLTKPELKKYEYHGEMMSIYEIARAVRWPARTLLNRLNRGMSEAEAFSKEDYRGTWKRK